MADLPAPDADAARHSQQLEALLRAEILQAGGFIPFSRFMERCLYAPGLGYYSAGSTKFGTAGDFVTAPELGPLFAGCIAAAVAPVLQQLGPDAGFVEIGGNERYVSVSRAEFKKIARGEGSIAPMQAALPLG